MNHWLCFSIVFTNIFLVRNSEQAFRTLIFGALQTRMKIPFWDNRSIGVPSCPASPRLIPPLRCAPPRPDSLVVYSGLRFDNQKCLSGTKSTISPQRKIQSLSTNKLWKCCRSYFLEWHLGNRGPIPGHALHEKGLQRRKGVFHWSAAKNKECFSPR